MKPQFQVYLFGTHPEVPEVVKTLITMGADLNARDKDGLTPLHAFVSYALDGVELNPEADRLAPKIISATRRGRGRCERANRRCHPPYPRCVQDGFQGVIKGLAEAGADPNATCALGATALHFAAAATEWPFIVEALLEVGADASKKDKNGYIALDFARNNKNLVNSDALRKLQAEQR